MAAFWDSEWIFLVTYFNNIISNNCLKVSYIHRIGRTGRAGKNGTAITYFTESDRPVLKLIAQVVPKIYIY